MPTVLRSGPYRFYFYSSDGEEPRHVHVQGADGVAKYWLEPVRISYSQGFKTSELSKIRSIIDLNAQQLIEA